MSASKSLIAALLLCLALCGCQDEKRMRAALGHYQGSVLIQPPGSPNAEQPDAVAELTRPERKAFRLSVELTSAPHTVEAELSHVFEVKWAGPGKIIFTETTLGSFRLKSESANCLVSREKTGPQVRLCYDGREISLQLPGMTYFLDKVVSGDLPVMETPASYTLSQLIARGQDRSFASREEFEHVVQAQLSARASFLNLLPHFTANTILSVASLNWLTIGKVAGDLIPFLLPNRWFRAVGEKDRYQAEKMGWFLMKADASSIAESLAYEIARDEASIQRLKENYGTISQVRDEILEREHSGLIQAGSSEDVDAILNSIEKAVALVTESSTEKQASLAQAEGFINPKAISGITEVPEITPASLRACSDCPDENAILSLVMERSFELKQLAELVEYAKAARAQRIFTWLDPSGDATWGIGFGYGDTIAVGTSQLRELMIRREQMQSLLVEKVSTTLSQAEESSTAYGLAVSSSGIQERRIQRLTENMRLGTAFVLSDLVQALQEKTKSGLEQVGARFAYAMSLAKLERLKLSGPYLPLLSTSLQDVAKQDSGPRP